MKCSPSIVPVTSLAELVYQLSLSSTALSELAFNMQKAGSAIYIVLYNIDTVNTALQRENVVNGPPLLASLVQDYQSTCQLRLCMLI